MEPERELLLLFCNCGTKCRKFGKHKVYKELTELIFMSKLSLRLIMYHFPGTRKLKLSILPVSSRPLSQNQYKLFKFIRISTKK